MKYTTGVWCIITVRTSGYELFRTRAKITTYKSLKWHLLVLWYLNPQLDQDRFEYIARHLVK